MRIETELDGKTVGAIERHYLRAKEKHPYFCDGLVASQLPSSNIDHDEDTQIIAQMLHDARIKVSNSRNVLWSSLLDEEEIEVLNEIINGNTFAAVEECYDAIAVLLRVVDVLEGRQKLGKPTTKGETK